jgi:Domain of unknown function (DUF5666)
MNKHDPIPAGLTRRQTLLAMLGAAGLTACGGGGDVAGVGQGGTGAFSIGPITGLGSIIVNGIRYDDSGASISSDDDSLSTSDLQLGMVVAVQGSPALNGQSTATRIVLGGELVGPISSISTSSFVVLGQTVNVTTSTFYAPSISGGLSGLAVGQVVEVHGIADTVPNTLTATFVERKSSPSEYKLQGKVTAHNATDKTFSIGGLAMSYASTDADDVRVTPVTGALVRVRLQAVSPAPAVWAVTRIRKPEDSFSGFSGEVEFKGTITAFTSTASFSVNDLPVNASGASFPEGTGGIVAGAFVEVKGALVNGVVVATRVKPDDGAAGGAGTEFELHGSISGASSTGDSGSFTLTSSGGVAVTVNWSNSSVEFRDGASAADLVNGQQIEVKGTLSNGSTVTATRIGLED